MRERIRWIGVLAVLGVTAAACGGSGDDETPAFQPSSGAVQIGTTGIYLPHGSRVESAPAPTKSEDAPAIKSVTAAQTGTNTFVLTLNVDASALHLPRSAYLDFGADGVYKTPFDLAKAAASGTADYAQQCRDLLAKQNITCTDACIQACACVTCSDATIAKNLKLACATTCSANVSSGAIKSAPYNGSEVTLANVVYNGSPEDGLQGSAKQAGCDASACPTGSTSTDSTGRKTATYLVTFEAPTIPQATPLVAPQVQTVDPVITSEPAGAARVSLCHQNETMPCR